VSTWTADHREVTVEHTQQPSGEVTFRMHATFDGEGNELLTERDDDGDGTWDFRTERADAAAQSTFRTDVDGDGTWDAETVTAWNADGQAAVVTVDDPLGGAVESRTTFTYDAAGNPLLVRTEWPTEASVDTYDYSCW
jgi:hypothetical protein